MHDLIIPIITALVSFALGLFGKMASYQRDNAREKRKWENYIMETTKQNANEAVSNIKKQLHDTQEAAKETERLYGSRNYNLQCKINELMQQIRRLKHENKRLVKENSVYRSKFGKLRKEDLNGPNNKNNN